MSAVNWPAAIKPLLKKYKGKKHPLNFKNIYQLVVEVILSGQDSDKHINQIAPVFFNAFPNMKTLAKATPLAIRQQINGVRNFNNKSKWLSALSRQIKEDKNIPLTLNELTELPGIGRKSANVIKRESGAIAEGIIVDIHVVRVAPRLGIASGNDPKKIEEQLMEVLPQKEWDAGMAMSFLGREICRPKLPNCEECIINSVCAYYKSTL